MSRRVGLSTVAFLSLVVAGCADRPLSTMDPESPIARDLDTFLVNLLWICLLVFVLVQGAVIYMAMKFRVKAPEDESQVYPDEEFPEQVHGNTRLEVGWTIAPAVIMAIVAFFTLGLLFSLNADAADEPNQRVVDVNVVAQQWWWEFQYDLDGDNDVDFVTAGELVIPEDEEIQLNVTSRDVIHSFWIPTLNGKRDAVPGQVNPWKIEAGNSGRFPGECTEFCGLSHAYMEKFVVALPDDEWDAWAANQVQDASLPEEGTAAYDGWKLFEAQCQSCHVINGLTERARSADGEAVPDDWSLYATDSNNGSTRYIEENVQVAGVAPNLTHFATRSSFAGGIFELYDPVDITNAGEYSEFDGLYEVYRVIRDAEEGRTSGLFTPAQLERAQNNTYTNLAENGVVNRADLEAWIHNAPEQKANAWDSKDPDGNPRPRGMTPFDTLSPAEIDNLVAFLMTLD